MGDMNIDTLEHSSSSHKLTELCDTLQWHIQTSAMGSREPIKTANINSIQFIKFVLGKSNNQGHDSIFR